MSIGERIKQKRTERGLSQRALARCAAVGNTHISKLESGRQDEVSLDVAKRLALALGVSIDYLAGMYEQEPPA